MNEPRTDLEMQIVERDGKVILLFSERVNGERVTVRTDHMMLPPDVALQAAQLLTDIAFSADTGLKPVGPALKAELVQRHREKLVPRVALILNSLRDKKTVSNGALALKIVDVIFSEVFS